MPPTVREISPTVSWTLSVARGVSFLVRENIANMFCDTHCFSVPFVAVLLSFFLNLPFHVPPIFFCQFLFVCVFILCFFDLQKHIGVEVRFWFHFVCFGVRGLMVVLRLGGGSLHLLGGGAFFLHTCFSDCLLFTVSVL